MATGAYDANGIWNYGEDDNIALFSDTLNMLAESTSDAFTDDRSRLSTLEAGSLSGLIPVSPASVVVATGTAAVNSLGVVSFTGATGVSLNGIFTSNYTNYRLMAKITASTATATISLRYRAAGTDNTTSNYRHAYWAIRTNDSNTMITQNGDNKHYVLDIVDSGSLIIDFTAPQATQRTHSHTKGFGVQAGWNASISGDGTHATTTSFDGFTIYSSAGNFTGTFQVFGYND
jgi:hypothetical protein